MYYIITKLLLYICILSFFLFSAVLYYNLYYNFVNVITVITRVDNFAQNTACKQNNSRLNLIKHLGKICYVCYSCSEMISSWI